ncbi:hypothetical protein J7E70_01930 [Variovorax paradoxus]|nr:hypothetical protein [Variovorax paradoxus]MBT2299214.1 hypothetical protein [Variovorax paradoxus]
MNHGSCIHFNGVRDASSTCGAGVNYHLTFGDQRPGLFLRMPCIMFYTKPAHRRGTYVKPGEPTVREEVNRRGETCMECAQRQEPTDEQVARDRVDSEAALARAVAGIRIASTWRAKPKPARDRAEVVVCPICNGKLHLSQSALNGHVHGRCETDGCISWME